VVRLALLPDHCYNKAEGRNYPLLYLGVHSTMPANTISNNPLEMPVYECDEDDELHCDKSSWICSRGPRVKDMDPYWKAVAFAFVNPDEHIKRTEKSYQQTQAAREDRIRPIAGAHRSDRFARK
jgi:hypothetical protein